MPAPRPRLRDARVYHQCVHVHELFAYRRAQPEALPRNGRPGLVALLGGAARHAALLLRRGDAHVQRGHAARRRSRHTRVERRRGAAAARRRRPGELRRRRRLVAGAGRGHVARRRVVRRCAVGVAA